MTDNAAEPLISPVNSHNEWDPLEEVIVGRLDGATIPSGHPVVACNIPPWAARLQGVAAGFKYPRGLIEPAQHELDQFIALLQSLGITVTRPDPIDERLLKMTSMCGKWLSMNILMIDEKRVIAERHHIDMLRALEKWGFEPIPCDLLHYAPFGGSFHCAALDIRRRGTLESYFH